MFILCLNATQVLLQKGGCVILLWFISASFRTSVNTGIVRSVQVFMVVICCCLDLPRVLITFVIASIYSGVFRCVQSTISNLLSCYPGIPCQDTWEKRRDASNYIEGVGFNNASIIPIGAVWDLQGKSGSGHQLRPPELWWTPSSKPLESDCIRNHVIMVMALHTTSPCL